MTREHKYRAIPTTVGGIRFASKIEATRYQQLLLLQRAGHVKAIELQPEFLLQEAFEYKGKTEKPITYKADFKITYPDGRVIYEDVKGFKTKEFQRTRKLLLYRYRDIEFRVTSKGGTE